MRGVLQMDAAQPSAYASGFPGPSDLIRTGNYFAFGSCFPAGGSASSVIDAELMQ
jgi:hypothetical protein